MRGLAALIPMMDLLGLEHQPVPAGRVDAWIAVDDVNEPQSLPARPRGVYKPISDLLSTISEFGAYAN
jgi:hypothetical protein